MAKAYIKDIWRSIIKGKKRFFSILLITALGVTMLTGIKSACIDLRYSADQFFDAQNLFDINIVSTLGLTDDDIKALTNIEGINAVQGDYSETVSTKIEDKELTAEVKTFQKDGLNIPYLLDGSLPEKTNEIAVTQEYMLDSGKSLGDTLIIEEDIQKTKETDTDLSDINTSIDIQEEETPNFINTEYIITGIVTDPMDINSPYGSISFRSTSTTDYTFFVLPESVDSDVYTSIYLSLSDSKDMLCYSDEYDDKVDEIINEIETTVKGQREQARYDEILKQANDKLSDAQREMDDNFDEADKELSDAQKELIDAQQELDDGQKELDEQTKQADEEFSKAYKQIQDGYAAIKDGQVQLEESEAQLNQGQQQLIIAKNQLAQQQDQVNVQISQARSQLKDTQSQTNITLNMLLGQAEKASAILGNAWPKSEWDDFISSVEGAYLPVTKIQIQISQLEQQLSSIDSSSPEYEQLNLKLSSAKEQMQKEQMLADENIDKAKNAFLNVLSPILDNINKMIDAQIAALDPNAPDYDEQLTKLQEQKQQLNVLPDNLLSLGVGIGQLKATNIALDEQLSALDQQQAQADNQFNAAWKEISERELQIAEGKKQISEGYAEIERNRLQLDEAASQLSIQEENAKQQIDDGKQELDSGREQLIEGQQQWNDSKQEYEETKKEAEQQLADAREEMLNIDMAQWYVQDRKSLSGYANIESDAGSIEAVGTAFPIVFFIVAILISLTTITRMVEEDRGLIGTYKALGFKDREIRAKYLLYVSSASLLGGLLGDLCGFILLPKIIISIFKTMYLLPDYFIKFDFLYGIGGILLFAVGIIVATILACKSELKQMPAVLMRPKSPGIGSRIFLEHIKPLWKRLSFLNKVTARNLFRYKKRLLMTIMGIMGCTALLLYGFAIKDSVTDLMPLQYEHINQYDIMAVASSEDNEKLLSYLNNDENVADYINVQIESVQLKNSQGEEETVQMIVVPEENTLEGYIRLENLNDDIVQLNNDGIFVTQNAANVLNFKKGSTISLQDMQLTQKDVKVSELVHNYLGNMVFMTEDVYETYFGEYKPNGVLVNLAEICTNQPEYAENLRLKDGVISCISTETMKNEFSTAFSMINMVVYIIILMAAVLALVVLFTLSTTNISERQRELATIKVLGFYDREVHLYVNKETLILTIIGIILGMPLGYLLGISLTYVLNIPSIYFAVSIHPVSYLISAIIAFAFALIVNIITNRVLDRIDPVKALKSVE